MLSQEPSSSMSRTPTPNREEDRTLLLPSSQHHQRWMSRSRWRTQFACGSILLTETFERIAFYGIIGNLVMLLNSEPFDWASYNAANALFVFTGLSYTTALFGGWIADSLLGRFKTITIAFVLYIGGYIFFPLLYPFPDIHANVTGMPPKWCSSAASQHNNSHNNSHPGFSMMTLPPTHVPESDHMTCQWGVYLALTILGIGNGAVKANIAPFGADQVY